MKKYLLILTLLFPLSLEAQIVIQPDSATDNSMWNNNSKEQSEEETHIYAVNPLIEIPVALGLSALTGYGFKKIDKKSGSTQEEIFALDYTRDVAKINRWTSDPQYSATSANRSDYLFYGSFALGLIPAFDKNINKDYMRILLMYWEALALTGSIYSMTVAHVDKYRPLAYSSDAPMDERLEDGAKNSFPGGHPALTATATFFVAKVFSDYYPHRKGLKVTLYSSAAVLTLANAYLRWDAGKHFPTDVMIGMTYGTLVGILVPELHKLKKPDNRFSFGPFPGGLQITYSIK